MGVTFSVTLRYFQDGNLVFVTQLESDRDYVEFTALYEKGVEWAKNHLVGLYHSEYYQISLLNNQLIDSKRALSRANQKLKRVISELEEMNYKLQEAEKQAKDARITAENANRQKSEFMANMSHDIRTPMNAIVGLSALMEHDVKRPEKILNYVGKLQTTSQHLLGLLNDILDLSKIENGSGILQIDSVNLAKQLSQVEAVIRPQAKERMQSFRIRTKNISHEYFYGDAVRLRQVLLNLLSNAVKYTPKNKVKFFWI